MLTIDEIPCGLKPFFDACLTGGGLSKPQYAHFWPTVLAFAVSFRGRNVQELYACMQDEACRQKLNDFLTESPWEGPRVLAAACLFAFALLKLKPGEELFIVLDGTQKLKRGKKIEALGKVKDATRKYPAPGHRYLIVYLRVRGIMLPWSVSLYLPKKWLASAEGKAHAARTGATFKTMNTLAAEVIAALPKSWRRQYRVTVLMDSGFCNKVICPAVRQAGFHFVVAAQSSRTLIKGRSDGCAGKKIKLSRYAPGRLKFQGWNVELPPKRKGGKPRAFRLAEVTGWMKGIGLVKCVFSRRKSDGSLLSIVSSDCSRSAKEVALAYGWRWEIEVAIKGLKGRLGLGSYCQRYVEGAVHHLHLSLLAHLLLAVSDLLRSGTAANTKCDAPQCPSISQLQDRLRVRVWRGLLRKLRDRRSARNVIHHLYRALKAS
jgi:hypothetical protein